jgi:hypothetical protein
MRKYHRLPQFTIAFGPSGVCKVFRLVCTTACIAIIPVKRGSKGPASAMNPLDLRTDYS